MSGFRLTTAALFDLKAIGIHTEQEWGRAQRNRYLRQFDDCFRQLAHKPALGRTCDEVRPGFRKIPVGRHLVFYRADQKAGVLIVRILHQRMDADRHLEQ